MTQTSDCMTDKGICKSPSNFTCPEYQEQPSLLKSDILNMLEEAYELNERVKELEMQLRNTSLDKLTAETERLGLYDAAPMEQDWDAIKDDLNQWNNHNKLISRGSECIHTMDALERLRAADAAKDAEILRLREALNKARNSIEQDKYYDAKFTRDEAWQIITEALKPNGEHI